ncbi:hypothetical protein ACFVYT_42035 [Streptomyces sp. NPDC058290]|uniref:hypothetical protein n=1 Tax=Streptomyces sp. NPDC058290 TaxID=3346426 RepID=UPI0036EE5F45
MTDDGGYYTTRPTANHLRQPTVRGGLKDLEAEKLVISPGSAVRICEDGVRVTEKLWTLTSAGPVPPIRRNPDPLLSR